MSSASSGSYNVVSREELRRRRLAAAQSRHQRILQDLAELNAEIRAVATTYAVVTSGELTAAVPAGDNAEAWEAECEALTAQIATRRATLAVEVAQARTSFFASAFSGLAPSQALASGAQAARPASSASAASAPAASDSAPAARAAAEAELQRVLRRLPAGASSATVARCRSLAARYWVATGTQEREHLLSAIRLDIQSAQDRERRVERNRRLLEALYRQLDGFTGRDVETLRGHLKGVPLDLPLPPDLAGRVADVARRAAADRDRDFVLAKAAEVLEQLGHVVGEGFVTAVAHDGALVDLRSSDHHGFLVRERDGQLLVNVVRYDELGQRDPVDDMRAEEHFCEDFAAVRAQLLVNGVDLELTRSDPPGSRPAQVVRTRPARVAPRARARQAPRQRNTRS